MLYFWNMLTILKHALKNSIRLLFGFLFLWLKFNLFLCQPSSTVQVLQDFIVVGHFFEKCIHYFYILTLLSYCSPYLLLQCYYFCYYQQGSKIKSGFLQNIFCSPEYVSLVLICRHIYCMENQKSTDNFQLRASYKDGTQLMVASMKLLTMFSSIAMLISVQYHVITKIEQTSSRFTEQREQMVQSYNIPRCPKDNPRILTSFLATLVL